MDVLWDRTVANGKDNLEFCLNPSNLSAGC